jgi:hypothetical protein
MNECAAFSLGHKPWGNMPADRLAHEKDGRENRKERQQGRRQLRCEWVVNFWDSVF